jgi:hypothetical protein
LISIPQGKTRRITNSFSYLISDPPSNTNHINGELWETSEPNRLSPTNFRLISSIIENYRAITCWHKFYLGNSPWLCDSSRSCVDQITYSQRHTINGDLPELRNAKTSLPFSPFLAQTHQSRNRQRTRRKNVYSSQISSFDLSALIREFTAITGTAQRYEPENFTSLRTITILPFFEPFCPAEISESRDTKP